MNNTPNNHNNINSPQNHANKNGAGENVYQFDKLMINVKELSTSLKNIEKNDNQQNVSSVPILFTCDSTNLDDDSSNETLMSHQSSSNRQHISNTTFNTNNFNSNNYSNTNSNIIELKKIPDNNQTNNVEMDWNDQEFYQLCQEIVETDSLFNTNSNNTTNNKSQQETVSNLNINISQNNLMKHQNFDPNTIILSDNQSQHSVLSLSTLKELQNQSQEPIMYIKQINNSNTNGLNGNTNHITNTNNNNNNSNSNTYQFDLNQTQQIYLQQVQPSQQQYANVIINHQGALNDSQNKMSDPLIGRNLTSNHLNNSIANQNSNNNINNNNNSNNNNTFFIDNNSDANILTLPWDFESDFNTLAGYLQSPTI